MLAIILTIIIAIRFYKVAREHNRSGIAWALIAVITFLGIQILVGLIFGFTIALGQEFGGWKEDLNGKSSAIANIIGMILSLIGILTISNYLNKISDGSSIDSPPEPPKFR